MIKKILQIKNKFWLMLTAIMAGSLLVPNLVWADYGTVVGNFLGKVLFYMLFWPFIALFRVEVLILPFVAKYNNFTNQAGVELGWIAARDLVNMLFIVVLLVMAFGTILKVQSYGYKELLRKLLIMALLVNFSRTIVGLVIDFFQVIMLTLVSAWADVAAGNFAVALGLTKLVNFAKVSEDSSVASGNVASQIIIGYLLGGVMMIIACIVIMAFILVLVARIVMLWIIIVLSPIAFFANTFPKGESYFQRWMDMFTKELMIGPMLAFFLWLSFMIVGGQQKNNIADDFITGGQHIQGGDIDAMKEISGIGITEAGQWDNVLNYIVGIAMLVGALKVTSTFGAMAGGLGSKVAGGMQRGVGKAYRSMGKGMVVGSSGYGGVIGMGGKVMSGIGKGMEESKIKPLRSLGIGLQEAEKYRARKHEAGKVTSRFAEAVITDDKIKQKFYEGRAGTDYDEYRVKTEGGNLFDPKKSTEENAATVERALAWSKKLGNTKMQEQIEKTSVNAFDGSQESQDKLQNKIRKDGATAVRDMETGEFYDNNGQLTTNAYNVVKQASLMNPEERKKLLNSVSTPDKEIWEKAFREVAAEPANIVGQSTGDNTRNQPMIIEDPGKDRKINKDSRSFDIAGNDPRALAAILNSPMLNVDHADNKNISNEDKTVITQRRTLVEEEVGAQLAKNIKPEAFSRIRAGDEKSDGDNAALRAMSKHMSFGKAFDFIVSSKDKEQIQIVIDGQLAQGNAARLAAHPLTSSLLKHEDVGSNFEEQVYGASAKERGEIQKKLARQNLEYAAEAYKISPRDKDGKLQRDDKGNLLPRVWNTQGLKDFASFVNTLDSKKALQIDKRDLEEKGVFDNLSDALQEALVKAGVGSEDRIRTRQRQVKEGTAEAAARSNPISTDTSQEAFEEARRSERDRQRGRRS